LKNNWTDIGLIQPEHDSPCEYIIEVKCRGWFRPDGVEPRFAADERVPPETRMSVWRHWDEGEPWPEGQKLVREFRQKKAEETNE